ncbi:MAG TPA: tetratricopeptide repeat protein [Gemmatimonadaceae bacterium]|nr:tetratricopeptide repeat protein [Gemmatimonadaceae bacterium]
MSDDIRRLSDALARDPSSTVFLQLGEALRRKGDRELALRVALRGLERHPHLADAHDLLARISADAGDLERAFDEWDMVLRLAPEHPGALKGMGFLRYRLGELEEAERLLAQAAAADATDTSIRAALAHVRTLLTPEEDAPIADARPAVGGGRLAEAPRNGGAHDAPALSDVDVPPPASINGNGRHARVEVDAAPPADRANRLPPTAHPSDPRELFRDVLGESQQTALLLDASGFVLAGTYPVEDGHDVAQDVGAELSGVSDEAGRAMRHLGLGDWSSIVFETTIATVAMAPAPDGGLLLVAASRETPLGLVRRVLDRAGERARRWLATMGGSAA